MQHSINFCNLGITISITGGKKRRKRGRLRERRGSFVDVVVSPPPTPFSSVLSYAFLSPEPLTEKERGRTATIVRMERELGPPLRYSPLLSPPSEKKITPIAKENVALKYRPFVSPFMLPSPLHPIHAPLLATTCKPSSSSSSALSDPR